jgi:lipoprotein NlpI
LKIALEKGIGDIYFSLCYFICLQRIGDTVAAGAHISKIVSTLESDAWSAPIARFYAGEITEEAVFAAAGSDDTQMERGKKCEAYYYIGMMHLCGANIGAGISPDTTRAMEYFKKCLDTNMTDYFEYVWAEKELDRINIP